ncbi:YtxH domain-containing protein [Hufsiella ginkgonis]|uniref:YtxH domain-containing protein n=1 Tax=Hufsiella ginkgonis TaxID=2695274 RepID=A0A7K1XSV8_9SPHI|nr:YtxH domain-containing protein [Hufsiella ginkgonis]MXV14085.1 YtxH domain-containing protein [Hufsiella ginkgonis]
MKDTKVIIALLAGLATGAALGILFAPEKGTDTRDKLSESLKSLGDSIKEKAAAEVDQLTALATKLAGNFKAKAATSDVADDLPPFEEKA